MELVAFQRAAMRRMKGASRLVLVTPLSGANVCLSLSHIGVLVSVFDVVPELRFVFWVSPLDPHFLASVRHPSLEYIGVGPMFAIHISG